MRKIFLTSILLSLLATLGYSQCCNVISSNGINAITSNGICVTTASGAAGDCGEAKAPDSDKDGVPDAEDVCPNEPGVLSNKGCPEVSKEEIAILKEAIVGIHFESAKDIITTDSYAILDKVVTVLNNKPAYKLDIEGHTDSQGDDNFNLELSKKRAAAVKKYLSDKGIASSRLYSEGYGETVPRADNETSAGRALNRRVELKVKF